MSEVKRYKLIPGGETWILASDYDALAARVAELEAALVEIRTHPNSYFNVAACVAGTPTIMDIAGSALGLSDADGATAYNKALSQAPNGPLADPFRDGPRFRIDDQQSGADSGE